MRDERVNINWRRRERKKSKKGRRIRRGVIEKEEFSAASSTEVIQVEKEIRKRTARKLIAEFYVFLLGGDM